MYEITNKAFRIYCVDDEESVCRFIRQSLEGNSELVFSGYSTETAGVMAYVMAEQPDMLIIDLHLDSELCISLVRDIRGLGGTIRQPIILLLSREDLVDACESIGADGSLKKGEKLNADHLLSYIDITRTKIAKKGINMLNGTRAPVRSAPSPAERRANIRMQCIRQMNAHHVDRTDLSGYDYFVDLMVLAAEKTRLPSLLDLRNTLCKQYAQDGEPIDEHTIEQSVNYFIKNAITEHEWMGEAGNPFAAAHPIAKTVFKEYHKLLRHH